MKRALARGLGPLLAAVTASSSASALVTQPNGSIMPVDSANGEIQLYSLFDSLGEPIDYQQDGGTTPATFSPLCDFTATLVLSETSSVLAVGWYNVDPNAVAPPPDAQIHVIVAAGSPVGTIVTAADIKNDPAYAGGQIGFALVGWQTHFTEQKWNPVCSGCNPPGPWVTAVIYTSKNTPNAYYIAFEDGQVGPNPGDFNNDGDYNDYVYLLTGLTCSGGGEPCDTGLPGVCAAGVTQCTPGGVDCQGVVPASDDSCNGLDDDCDGAVDEGDLCVAGFVCDKGSCVEECGTGEFTCPSDKVCDDEGYCVDPECADVDCDEGQICVDGACKAPCDGVVCPFPTVCRVGVCVDPCAAVVCGDGQVCDAGVCRSLCACAPCGDGLACDDATGLCVEPACLGNDCPAGTHCVAGACVDACEGASCPAGQVCEEGQCVDDPGSGAGGGAATSSASGFEVGGGGPGATTTTSAGGAGAGAGGAEARGGDDNAGCGCRAPGGEGVAGRGALALALAGLALSAGRRRARRACSSTRPTTGSTAATRSATRSRARSTAACSRTIARSSPT
jgi:hypothetical protein